jgi:hypothetical protein
MAKRLTVKDAIGVLSSEDTVIYYREGLQPKFQRELIDLIERLAKKKEKGK